MLAGARRWRPGLAPPREALRSVDSERPLGRQLGSRGAALPGGPESRDNPPLREEYQSEGVAPGILPAEEVARQVAEGRAYLADLLDELAVHPEHPDDTLAPDKADRSP